MCKQKEIDKIILIDDLKETPAESKAVDAFYDILEYFIEYRGFDGYEKIKFIRNIKTIQLILGDGKYEFKVDDDGIFEPKLNNAKPLDDGYSNEKYEQILNDTIEKIKVNENGTLLMLDSVLDDNNINEKKGRERSESMLNQVFDDEDVKNKVKVLLYSAFFDNEYKKALKEIYKDLIIVDSSVDNPENMAFQIVKGLIES
ncbi:hypothetical protein OfM1_10200 [Lactovum odontotermitis]